MSNNARVNDDEIEIHQLPEVSTLQAGMMVAVDSQPTGTKSFNLTTALEGKASANDFTALENTVSVKANTSDVTTALEGKVDAPTTTPAEGQVLTFNGSANTWANPPEGVYVLNYTEVSDLNDIDINRVKTQPTFMKVDTDITVSIPTSGTPYTVTVQQGTLMAIDEIGSEGTSGSYTGPRFISFYANNGKGVDGGIMQNADLKLLCMVSLSPFGGVTKTWGANGFLNNDGALLRTMPAPVTTKCTNSRGPGSDSVTTNHALKVEIQSCGSIRTQSLLPAEIETHDFYNDSTPEQIQFMGWGATSDRAGYKNLITAQHNYDSTNFPIQTPQVQFLKLKMSGGTPESDQVMNVVQANMKSADGQSTTTIGGILVPTLGTVGALQYWSDNNGAHYGFKPVNEVPASTAQDEGKVLTVDSNGAAAWAASGGGREKFIIRGLVYPASASSIINDNAVVDKTTTEIRDAYESGQELELQFYPVNDTTVTSADIDSKFAEQKNIMPLCIASLTSADIPESVGNISFGFIFKSLQPYSFMNYVFPEFPSAYEYTRLCSQIRINIGRYSGGDSDRISAYSEANDLGNWKIQVDNWNDTETETYGNNWDYFYDTVKYYMNTHNSIELEITNDSVNGPIFKAYLSDYLFSNNPSYPPFLLLTHLYIPACRQGQAYRTEARWFKFYPSDEVDPYTGETVKMCKLSYGEIATQPMLPNLFVNGSSGFTISSSPWILPENNTYITPEIDSSLTELVILVSKDTIGFNAASNPQFTMKFSLEGGRTLRVRVGEQYDSGGISYFNYDADKGRDLVSPSGVYNTYFNIKVVGRSWTFEKLAVDSNS